MFMKSLLISALAVGSAYAATADILLCNTRPLPTSDITSSSSYQTFVEPQSFGSAECMNATVTLDWSVKVPFTDDLSKFYNTLSYAVAPSSPSGIQCELYIDESCGVAGGDVLSQSDCVSTEKHSGTVGMFFIEELPYYQGTGLKCMRCGTKEAYEAGEGGVKALGGVCGYTSA